MLQKWSVHRQKIMISVSEVHKTYNADSSNVMFPQRKILWQEGGTLTITHDDGWFTLELLIVARLELKPRIIYYY